MSNELTAAKSQILTILEGILLGRTLQDLEKQAGVSAELLLKRLAHDEEAFLDFKQAREYSAYAIEDDLTTRARDNLDNPRDTVTNNALKIYMDHMHWVAERRNPAMFSGKAAVNVTVPIQIHTDLDLNQKKNIEGIYELEAQLVQEKSIEELQDPSTVVEAEFAPAPGPSNPFSAAILASTDGQGPAALGQEAEEAQDGAAQGSEPAGRHNRVASPEQRQHADVQSAAAAPVPRKKPRAPRPGARKDPAKGAKKAGGKA